MGGAGFDKNGLFDISKTMSSGLDVVLRFQNVYLSETARDRFYNRLKLILSEINIYNNKIAEQLKEN